MNWFHWKRKEPPPPEPAFTPAERCLSYRGANLQGIGARAEQQDAFAFVNLLDVTSIREQGILAVVADGMGGMEGGAYAGQTAVQHIREAFQAMDRTVSFYGQLANAFQEASRVIFGKLRGTGGTTAVACVIYDEKLWFASVGDSFLYLKRGGELYRLNSEQTILHEQYLDAIREHNVRSGAVEPDEESRSVSGFLGMGHIPDIDGFRRPFPLEDGDLLLLCSDGVAGVLTEEDLMFALAHPLPQEMCMDLERMILAKKRRYQDNYTALLLQCIY